MYDSLIVEGERERGRKGEGEGERVCVWGGGY